MFISDGGYDTIVVNTGFIKETGKEIENNADSLKKELNQDLNNFQQHYSISFLPSCLCNALHSYETTHRTELDKLVTRRHTIGDLLTKAANLHAFNEEMQKRGFANLYQNVNAFYGSNLDTTNQTNLQRGTSSSQ